MSFLDFEVRTSAGCIIMSEVHKMLLRSWLRVELVLHPCVYGRFGDDETRWVTDEILRWLTVKKWALSKRPKPFHGRDSQVSFHWGVWRPLRPVSFETHLGRENTAGTSSADTFAAKLWHRHKRSFINRIKFGSWGRSQRCNCCAAAFARNGCSSRFKVCKKPLFSSSKARMDDDLEHAMWFITLASHCPD